MCQPGRPGPIEVSHEGLAGLWRFPERKVAGIVLVVFVNVDASAVGHAGEIFFKSLP